MAGLVWTELEARKLLREHGLADKGWTFKFDNARKRAGLCMYGSRTISMSRYLVAMWGEDQVMQTLLHEVAHALTPGASHGPVWQAKAREIGFTRGTRTHNNEVVPGRYIAVCDTCNAEVYRAHRFTAAMRQGRHIHTTCRTRVRWVDTAGTRV